MSANLRGKSREAERVRNNPDAAAGYPEVQTSRSEENRPRSRPPVPHGGDQQAVSVRVVCRLRPMNDREKKTGTIPAASASTERSEVAVNRMVGGARQQRSTFHFDDVLTSFSTQEETFAATIKPLIGQVLGGYEATAFAYGQTGTGKTYTMEGEVSSEEGRGLVPRAAAAIINQLSSGEFTEHSITVSYLEIYNEELSDLLVPPQQQAKLDLKDVGGGRGVVCVGLSEVPVSTLDQILNLIHTAQERRRVAETRVNARSSRSHCIFTMKVRCRRKVSLGEFENVGKLHLVDLAGSECAKKAAAPQDDQSAAGVVRHGQPQAGALEEERERRSINQSLLTLGRVIAALRDNTGRVPYRDSKLTRLLQDALGGRCKTVVIATISPALSAVDETISALSYAEQASGIKNRPVASSLLRTTRTPNPAELGGTGNAGCGAADWAELEMKNEYLQQEVVEAQAALARKYRESQELLERAESAEQKIGSVEAQRDEALVRADESGFVRDRLIEFTDRQGEVARSFQIAFDAAAAHGQEIARLLETRCSMASSVRRQVRDLCAESETRIPVLEGANKQIALEVRENASAVHTAHKEASSTADDATTVQQQILENVLSTTKDVGKDWNNILNAEVASAFKALDEDQATNDAALAKIGSAASAAADAATQGTSAVTSAAKHGEQLLGQQADALQTDLSSEQEALAASATKAFQDFTDVCAAAGAAGEADYSRLQGTVRKPFDALKTSLHFNLDAATNHATELTAFKQQGVADARSAAQRRQSLLQAIHEATSAHAATAAASPTPLNQSLQVLINTLESRSDAANKSLSSASQRLADAKASLAKSMEIGRAGIEEGTTSADALLKSAWEELARGYEGLSTALVTAAAEQRAANAAVTLQDAARGTNHAISETLLSALQALEGSRADIARDVLNLREQRAAEQKMIALLTQQRESLQAEVEKVRVNLKEARSELAETRGQLTNLKDSQQRARHNALAKIKDLVESEMTALGTELDQVMTSACTRLESVTALAVQTEEVSVAAEKQSTSTGAEVSQVATEWSESVEATCATITDAQHRASDAAKCVDETKAMAAERLTSMEATSAEWGEKCENVAFMIDKAVAAVGDLQSAQDAVRPRWDEVQKSILSTAETWTEGDQAISAAIDSVALDSTQAHEELGKLHEEIATQHKISCEGVSAWSKNDEVHQVALGGLSNLGKANDKEDSTAEMNHAAAVDALNEEAIDLSDRATRARDGADAILQAVDAYAADIPAGVEANITNVKNVASTVAGLASRAGDCLARATTAVTEIHKVHTDTVGSMCEGDSEATKAVANATQDVVTTVANYKTAAEAADARSRGNWEKLKAASISSQEVADAAAKAALEKAHAATTESGKRMASALQGGADAHEGTLQAIDRLVSGASTGFAEQHQALLAGLTAEPLGAFQEPRGDEAVPSWPEAAARPKLEIQERPQEDQLLFEFREARVSKDVDNTDVESAFKADNEKPTKQSQILSLAPGNGNRVVLGVLNQ